MHMLVMICNVITGNAIAVDGEGLHVGGLNLLEFNRVPQP